MSLQAQATICPHCLDDHQPPCSVARMERLTGELAASESEARTECARLRAELAEAKKDTERLDWLERNTILAVGAGIQWEELTGLAVHEWHGEEPLRGAIDAARDGE